MLQIKSKNTALAAALVVSIALLSCEDEASPGLQGKGGSMARFALSGNHLYTVDETAIDVFQLSLNGALTKVGRVDAGFNVETIFATEENLFLGTTDAMHIFSLQNGPVPVYLSTYDHIISCDPVVVQGQFAYVSLRVSNCRNFGSDALDIVDIKDLQNPLLVSSNPVTSPYGLGVDDDLLFLCEGDQGMKVYNISDPKNINLLQQYTSLHAYDVIPNNGILVLTGNTGIYQYDYSDVLNIRQLSHIPSMP